MSHSKILKSQVHPMILKKQIHCHLNPEQQELQILSFI